MSSQFMNPRFDGCNKICPLWGAIIAICRIQRRGRSNTPMVHDTHVGEMHIGAMKV